MQAIPVAEFPVDLLDKTFFYQLRVDAYLLHVAAHHPNSAAPLRRLAAELMDASDGLTHADFTPKNMLVSSGEVVLLDFEVGHIGHPAFDVASVVNHLFLKSLRSTPQQAGYLQLVEDFLGGYMKEADDGLPREFWPMLGALMLARVRGKSPVEYLNEDAKSNTIRIGEALLFGEEGVQSLKVCG
jgi:thiamine kinase-like enzyme